MLLLLWSQNSIRIHTMYRTAALRRLLEDVDARCFITSFLNITKFAAFSSLQCHPLISPRTSGQEGLWRPNEVHQLHRLSHAMELNVAWSRKYFKAKSWACRLACCLHLRWYPIQQCPSVCITFKRASVEGIIPYSCCWQQIKTNEPESRLAGVIRVRERCAKCVAIFRDTDLPQHNSPNSLTARQVYGSSASKFVGCTSRDNCQLESG